MNALIFPALAVGASGIGSWAIGEGWWRTLEFQASRLDKAYQETMQSLLRAFDEYAKPILQPFGKKGLGWVISDQGCGITVKIPSCPHKHTDEKKTVPSSQDSLSEEKAKEKNLDSAWDLSADLKTSERPSCSLEQEKCYNHQDGLRKEEQNYLQQRDNLVGVSDHEIKWLCTALFIGTIVSMGATAFILPSATFRTKTITVLFGVLAGTCAAAVPTWSRLTVDEGF